MQRVYDCLVSHSTPDSLISYIYLLNKILNSSNMLCAWCKDMVMLGSKLDL